MYVPKWSIKPKKKQKEEKSHANMLRPIFLSYWLHLLRWTPADFYAIAKQKKGAVLPIFFFLFLTNWHSLKQIGYKTDTKKLTSLDRLTHSRWTINSSKQEKMKVICECSLKKPLPWRNLMNSTIESTNIPIKNLNRLSKKPWRFRWKVRVEKKKRFLKRKEKKKIHFTYGESKA